MESFNNIMKEIFRENADEIKIRITPQKWFHPKFLWKNEEFSVHKPNIENKITKKFHDKVEKEWISY